MTNLRSGLNRILEVIPNKQRVVIHGQGTLSSNHGRSEGDSPSRRRAIASYPTRYRDPKKHALQRTLSQKVPEYPKGP